MNKPSVLVVDDQPWQIHHLLAELREEFIAEVDSDPLNAARLLQANVKVDALLLDIMMPSPTVGLIEKTARGLDTGLWFLDHMSDLFIATKLPIIILSNRLKERIDNGVAELPYPTGQVSVRLKQETSDQLLRLDVRHAVLKRGELGGFTTADYLNALLGEFAEEIDLLSRKCEFADDLVQFVGNASDLSAYLVSEGVIQTNADAASAAFMPYIELYQLGCVGPRYSALLIHAGISSIDLLGAAEPTQLTWTIRALNQQFGLFEREFPPSENQVAHWIEVARRVISSRLSSGTGNGG